MISPLSISLSFLLRILCNFLRALIISKEAPL